MKDPATKKALLSRLIALACTVLLLAFLIFHYDWRLVWSAFGRARWGPLLLAGVVLVFSHLLGVTDRWRRILRLVGVSVSFREAWVMRMGGAPLKFFTPLRVGELLRLPYLSRQHGLTADLTLGALGFEKVTFLTGLLPALLLRGVLYGEIASLVSAFAVVLVLVIATAAESRELMLRLLAPFGERVTTWGRGLLAAFANAGLSGVFGQVIYAAIILACEAVVLALCLQSVGVEIDFARWWTVLPGVLLAGLAPVTFAGLGAREAALVVLFPHETPAALIAGGILFFVLARLAIAVAGLPWMPEYLRRMVEPSLCARHVVRGINNGRAIP